MALFAYLCAHGRRFGAHLGTQKEERTCKKRRGLGEGERREMDGRKGTEMRPE